MSDIEWNATLHWVRTWKSFVQIFLWELLEYFFLSAKMFWKELTVNLKINHEGLLWEGLQCADIFTSVPDDNQWRNECEMPTLTKRPVTIQDPAYLACTFSMTRAQFVGFWTTIEYLKTCIICDVMMSCVRNDAPGVPGECHVVQCEQVHSGAAPVHRPGHRGRLMKGLCQSNHYSFK